MFYMLYILLSFKDDLFSPLFVILVGWLADNKLRVKQYQNKVCKVCKVCKVNKVCKVIFISIVTLTFIDATDYFIESSFICLEYLGSNNTC